MCNGTQDFTKLKFRKGGRMRIKELMEYIQKNLNDGSLTLQSEVVVRDSWGDDRSVEYVRNYDEYDGRKLILSHTSF